MLQWTNYPFNLIKMCMCIVHESMHVWSQRGVLSNHSHARINTHTNILKPFYLHKDKNRSNQYDILPVKCCLSNWEKYVVYFTELSENSIFQHILIRLFLCSYSVVWSANKHKSISKKMKCKRTLKIPETSTGHKIVIRKFVYGWSIKNISLFCLRNKVFDCVIYFF